VIAGLVLAAGDGSRFSASESKLLALLDGRPLVEHAVRAACAVDSLERVVVVVGAWSDEVLKRVDFGRAEPVVCGDWSEGQSASLRCGVRALGSVGVGGPESVGVAGPGSVGVGGPESVGVGTPGSVEKVIVTLGDQPLVTPELIARFLSEPGGTRAVFGGRPGHPVVLGPAELEAVAGLTGDRGARELLKGGRRIECSDIGFGLDVDTPDDLEEIRHEARAVL
jgi:molybdenum cofactor cytidylyltransferase